MNKDLLNKLSSRILKSSQDADKLSDDLEEFAMFISMGLPSLDSKECEPEFNKDINKLINKAGNILKELQTLKIEGRKYVSPNKVLLQQEINAFESYRAKIVREGTAGKAGN